MFKVTIVVTQLPSHIYTENEWKQQGFFDPSTMICRPQKTISVPVKLTRRNNIRLTQSRESYAYVQSLSWIGKNVPGEKTANKYRYYPNQRS